MADGAMLQLILGGESFGRHDNAMTIIKHMLNPYRTVRFNTDNRFTIARQCDIIKTIFFTFKMAALPAGWIYKKCWTSHAFKQIELSIGGWRVLQHTQAHSRISELIFQPESREMSFDYTVEERRAKSLRPHEIIYEFTIKDVFGDAGIPLISLTFHEAQVYFQLDSLFNCIERDPAAESLHPLPPDDFNPIVEFLAQSVGLFLDAALRHTVAERTHEQPTIEYSLSSIVTQDDTGRESFYMQQFGMCSASYIHITNEDGSEIENQLLSKLEIGINGVTRFSLFGHQSRHQVRGWLPHLTRDNTLSQNLYYISYYTPPYLSTGAQPPESGLNLTRIERHEMCLIYDPLVPLPRRRKITVMHRMQNTFKIMNGISCFLQEVSIPVMTSATQYLQEEADLRERGRLVRRPIHSAASVLPATLVTGPPIFGINDTPISVSAQDSNCVITMEPILDNADVVQCQQCMKIATLTAMNEWFKRSKTCPCCRAKYGDVMFETGKAKKINILNVSSI